MLEEERPTLLEEDLPKPPLLEDFTTSAEEAMTLEEDSGEGPEPSPAMTISPAFGTASKYT
jgi:hypothetical protein